MKSINLPILRNIGQLLSSQSKQTRQWTEKKAILTNKNDEITRKTARINFVRRKTSKFSSDFCFIYFCFWLPIASKCSDILNWCTININYNFCGFLILCVCVYPVFCVLFSHFNSLITETFQKIEPNLFIVHHESNGLK